MLCVPFPMLSDSGGKVLPELTQATPQACRHAFTGHRSILPRVEYAAGIDGPDARCAVSVIACTGDLCGGWDGLEAGAPEEPIADDRQGGRLPEVIRRAEPAIMYCHWPGIHGNGTETGFPIVRTAVVRMHAIKTIWCGCC